MKRVAKLFHPVATIRRTQDARELAIRPRGGDDISPSEHRSPRDIGLTSAYERRLRERRRAQSASRKNQEL